MDDVQFKEFTSMLNCDKKGLTYSDFVACFQDLRTRGMGEVKFLKVFLGILDFVPVVWLSIGARML